MTRRAINWDEAESLIASLAVGVQLRRFDGMLCHVRALVDERAVIRWWSRGKQRWHYEVIGPAAFISGHRVVS